MREIKVLIHGKCDDDIDALRLYNVLYENQNFFKSIEFDYDDQFIETVVTVSTNIYAPGAARIVQEFLKVNVILGFETRVTE